MSAPSASGPGPGRGRVQDGGPGAGGCSRAVQRGRSSPRKLSIRFLRSRTSLWIYSSNIRIKMRIGWQIRCPHLTQLLSCRERLLHLASEAAVSPVAGLGNQVIVYLRGTPEPAIGKEYYDSCTGLQDTQYSNNKRTR